MEGAKDIGGIPAARPLPSSASPGGGEGNRCFSMESPSSQRWRVTPGGRGVVRGGLGEVERPG
jgi:hypothetical protein